MRHWVRLPGVRGAPISYPPTGITKVTGSRRITQFALLFILLTLPTDIAHLWERHDYYPPGALTQTQTALPLSSPPSSTRPCPEMSYPDSWEIRSAGYTDVTGDLVPECVLLVWRPWQDWPIMRWSNHPSPITSHQDATGYSAHIILTQPDPTYGYRELWAGSALAIPIVNTTTGDVDGDGLDELIVLEGTYKELRGGVARQIAVWKWNSFGFTLQARSNPGRFHTVVLVDSDRDGKEEILTR